MNESKLRIELASAQNSNKVLQNRLNASELSISKLHLENSQLKESLNRQTKAMCETSEKIQKYKTILSKINAESNILL